MFILTVTQCRIVYKRLTLQIFKVKSTKKPAQMLNRFDVHTVSREAAGQEYSALEARRVTFKPQHLQRATTYC